MGERSTKKPSGSVWATPARVEAILALLDVHYPHAQCSLDFVDPLQLLVSTILSAQCTDERVNQVTPSLFRKYPAVQAFAEASPEELENDIKSTGFYRNKARNIQACCKIIHEHHGGEIPRDLDTLVKLPGIGRKTANVILGNAFGIPGIVVDTHVGRVAQRLGLTAEKDPEKIEGDLMQIIPKERWIQFSHQLIQHGRRICQARKPKMDLCPLEAQCEYATKHPSQ
ncbi:MAG: endonuclease III [Syntrophobacteraceae bacterium]|nr:endonuclease III [Syntrophobacteraceae bacterium]